jgi:hypothetical protein
MPVFQIPEEYFGLVGIGNAIGGIGERQRERRETKRREEREDFLLAEAQRDAKRKREQDIIRDYGQGSQAHLDYLSKAGLPTEGVLVAPEVRNQQRLNELKALPTRTRAEQAELNVLEGKPFEGYEEQLASLDRKVKLEDLQVTLAEYQSKEAQFKTDQRNRFATAMQAKYDMSPEEFEAAMQWTAYQQARANLGLTQAQTNEVNAQAVQRRADAASTSLGVDLVQARQLATDLNRAGVVKGTPFSADFVAKGLAGRLTGQDKTRFELAFAQYNMRDDREALSELIRRNNATITRLRATANATDNKDEKERINADIAGLVAESRDAQTRFAQQRDATYAQIQGRQPAPRTAGETAASGAPVGRYADIIDDEVIAVARKFSSPAAIDASGLPAEEKEILKEAWQMGAPKGRAPATTTAEPNFPPRNAVAPAAAAPAARPAPVAEPATRPKQMMYAPGYSPRERAIQVARDERSRLEGEIAGLRADIASNRRNPMMTKQDRENILAWEEKIKTKQARIDRLNTTIGDR